MEKDSVTLRLKVFGGKDEAILLLLVCPQDTMEVVARQVRKAQEWGPEQHMRFISGGQELFMDDSVSRALGSVIHCIASQCPAQKFPAPKTGSGHKGAQSPAVDWLEVVEPGAVLMWIFGSILTLLWLLFVCYAHMFDRTSVIMLCMMTIAFLIPCVLSYAPALRLLHFPGVSSPSPRPHSSSYDLSRVQYSTPEAPAAGGWSAYSTGSSYAGAIPPRPAARVRPGTNPAS